MVQLHLASPIGSTLRDKIQISSVNMQQLGNFGVYITNVCNLNCQNCNSLSNFAFSGHQRWFDYSHQYQEWSQLIDPTTIFILGGEPMSNPDFLLWVHGIAELWPRASVKINTNGYYFDQWPMLYHEILRYQGRVSISISSHNQEQQAWHIGNIKNFLKDDAKKCVGNLLETHAWRKTYSDVRGSDWPETCDSVEDFEKLDTSIKQELKNLHKIDIHDYVQDLTSNKIPTQTFIDSNGIKASVDLWNRFTDVAVRFDSGRLTLHDSDPVKAITNCGIAMCHRMSRGKLYKCPILCSLKEFSEQFAMDISTSDKKLINSYQPAETNWDAEKLGKFVKDLKHHSPEPQCKFCPENANLHKITSTTRKIKIKKL
jgi:organic radical activating enzyme